ncbi:MAG: hypothetical protein ABR910_15675 [Acidobacteriaceae bacterium]|jgi:hypothetical protein
MDINNVGSTPGTFAFNTETDTGVVTNGPNAIGNAMAGFQMGYLSAFGQGGSENLADRNHFPGLYVQDQWKVNHKEASQIVLQLRLVPDASTQKPRGAF